MHVVVIGAGILGASTSFHLARAGARVTVIDRADPGRATAAGAGIICPWVSNVDDAAFYRLYVEGARYYGELVSALADRGETNLGFRRVGAMVVSDDTGELRALRTMLEQRRTATPDMGAISMLPASAARELFPPLRHDLDGLHIAGGARVDGRLMAAALSRAAQAIGARQIGGDATLVVQGGRVEGVRLKNETIAADAVVVAAGAWASGVLQPVGVRLPIGPQRGQIMHFGLPGQGHRTLASGAPARQPLSARLR